jgi:ribosome-binding protein aMBF1 (putative translation factor)
MVGAQRLPWEIVPQNNAPSPRQTRRVALLGIAQRTIHVKYPVNRGNQRRSKVLKLNIKTVGDWLKVKRVEKNLMPCHLAGKMGIATSLVCSWESNTCQPDSQQLEVLASILGFDAKVFETLTSNPVNLPCLVLENQT